MPSTYARPSYRPTFLLAAAGLTAALSTAIVSGQRPAEACASDCSQEWKKFELLTKAMPVPADAGVLLRVVTSGITCFGGRDPLSLTVVAASGEANVQGTLTLLETSSASLAGTEHTLLWKPATPLAPGASYTLEIDAPRSQGSAGGGGGTSEHASLPFTTSAAPLGAPAAPASFDVKSVAKKVVTSVCCSQQGPGGCGPGPSQNDCADAVEQSLPETTLTFAPSAAESDRAYFEYTVYEIAAGAPGPTLARFYGRDGAGSYNVQTIFDDGARHCLGVETRNLITGQALTTDAPCPELAAVDAAVTAHCSELARVIAVCSSNGGGYPVKYLDQRAATLFAAHCPDSTGGSGGSGNPGGADQGGGSGGAGQGGSGNPSGAGQGGSAPGANPGASDRSGGSDGCQVHPTLGAAQTLLRREALAGLGALAAIGRLVRRRRRG